MAKTHDGYLLIADITGYTRYLSKSELEHAQEILTALLELLVDHTRPPLVISRLAGDAVISYGLRDQFTQGQTFIEMIEDTYVAFRRAIERMVLNNACKCNACANVSSLDLKFFVHYGTFAIQRISDHDELVGSDVNLLHRLLKNQVTDKTGIRAYTLYTDAAIRQLGLEDISESMAPHAETYEHLGEVKAWVQDMHPVWEQKREATQIGIPPERITLQLETEIHATPELVWDYLSRPEFLQTLLGATRKVSANRVGGRVAPGSVYHCYHGDKLLPVTVLEWRPFELMLFNSLTPVPIPNTYALMELRLVPTGAGTRVFHAFSKATGPLLGRILCDLVMPMTAKQGQRDLEAFKKQMEDDLSARRSAVQEGGSPGSAALSPETISREAAASLGERG